MQGFMPRVRRRIDRNNWIPIGEGGNDRTTARNGSISTTARLNGPPDFDDPVEPQLSPPPTYSRLRDVSRPEIASLLVSENGPRGNTGRHRANSSPRRPPAPTARITNLDDIRHGERQVPMNNRLSSVPSYPVFLDQSDQNRTRRRSSIASTNTAGILLSVGSLPGSEPFEVNAGASTAAMERCTALGSHPPLSPLVSPLLSPFEASVAHVMTVHRVNRSSTISSPPSHHPSWQLDTAPNFADRWNPPSGGYYSPGLPDEPTVKPSQTWPAPALEQRAARQRADPRMQFRSPRVGARDINRPPTPPPKDPGYVARHPGRKHINDTLKPALRQTNSTPNLLLFPRTEPYHHGRTRSDMHFGQSAAKEQGPKTTRARRYSSSRKPSQILNMCAKFINRSIPRVSITS